MEILNHIKSGFKAALEAKYELAIDLESIQISGTRKEFEGDFTIVLFPYLKSIKKKLPEIGEEVGAYLVEEVEEVEDHNTIKGFLNLKLTDAFWKNQVQLCAEQGKSFGKGKGKKETVMVEFCSPNTNKPLHLGHIRNILLGWSTSEILKFAGYNVVNTQIINDRGIAVCKSMLSWKKFSDGETPESSGEKGDHFVGKYYVLFDQKLKEEYSNWQASETGEKVFTQLKKEDESKEAFFKRYKNSYFNDHSNLGQEAKAMLLKWEAGDKETVALWKKMNNWVYDGFEETYRALGVDFDKLYYESDTYLLGKKTVEKGLADKVFYQKPDGSVWINLEEAGMDEKIVLRSDGTAVYMTQDIGTAQVRYEDFKAEKMVYVVGDEQDYHFKVLFEIMKQLKEPFANGLFHLSYGMVDLPTGRMKSREGTVVDADDLVDEVIKEAALSTEERAEIEGLPKDEKEKIHQVLGLGALKFFILKVQPQKRMTFDPKSSVDMQGQTGPYIQNAFVRVQSLLRKSDGVNMQAPTSEYKILHPQEVGLSRLLVQFPDLLDEAAQKYDPSIIANYCYVLAKDYHRFYHDVRILSAETEAAKIFRLQLSATVANVLTTAMKLLGIDMPDRM